MCYKQADANDAAELFFAAANTINRSTTTTISTTDLMAAPATYLTFGLGDYLYAGQNWWKVGACLSFGLNKASSRIQKLPHFIV